MEIKLTRFNGGGKGPLLVWHGMGMTSEFATLDTIDVNLVEFFVSHNYDLWNVDWRSSPRLPAASSLQYSIDDVANYDIPAAVVKVLEVTGQVLYKASYLPLYYDVEIPGIYFNMINRSLHFNPKYIK